MQHERILMQVQGETHPLTLGGQKGPLLASTKSAWAGVPVELHDMRPYAGPEIDVGPTRSDLGVLVVLEGSIEITTRQGSVVHRDSGKAGAMRILSGDLSGRLVGVRGRARVAAINLSPSWLERIERAQRALAPRQFVDDPTIHGFARAFGDELGRGASNGPLFAESLSIALVGHLTDRYGSSSSAAEPARGQLSSAQRERLRDFVHTHFDRRLTLQRLSAEVGVSERHFVNLFRRSFGTSPHRYLLEHRVHAAAKRMASGERDLARIALAVGFSSQSHLTTAFRSAYGTTPARFAKLTAQPLED